MKLLVTGGAGFIGSNFLHYIIKEHPRWEVTNLDKLTYAGNLENLEDVRNEPKYRFVKGDITDRELIGELLSQSFDVIVNFAAESHVDRSIFDASLFIETNVKGTQVLLEGTKKYQIQKFIQVSTDEVYGSIDSGSFTEDSPLSPNNPYSASKASADLLCHAYFKTYHLPVIVTRCTNNYGPYQFPEKLIPLVITNALDNKPIPVYGDGLNVRDWIFVLDHCRAIDAVIQRGTPGEIYNIGGGNEKTNLEVVYRVLDLLDKPKSLTQFVSDRPGHDHRYAVDTTKITEELGWKPLYPYEEAFAIFVNRYLKDESWLSRPKNDKYAEYYDRGYPRR
ncbi:dTDP-glucose 4,6-dehydratase [Chloroflexota bacterium]